jgi:ABC-type polar amino acid transport system ATPase subunit
LIEIRNVSLWYRDNLKVVDQVSGSIEKGQTVVICGPSGSGKSSLLRCINGLERFQEGEIIVNGVSVQDAKTDVCKLRADIGMVFQHFELYPHMTVLQNITLALRKVREKKKEEAEEQAMELLTRVGIPEKASSYPGELSGGQQQRVAIARSLAMEPLAMLFAFERGIVDGVVIDVLKAFAMAGERISSSGNGTDLVTYVLVARNEFTSSVLYRRFMESYERAVAELADTGALARAVEKFKEIRWTDRAVEEWKALKVRFVFTPKTGT